MLQVDAASFQQVDCLRKLLLQRLVGLDRRTAQGFALEAALAGGGAAQSSVPDVFLLTKLDELDLLRSQRGLERLFVDSFRSRDHGFDLGEFLFFGFQLCFQGLEAALLHPRTPALERVANSFAILDRFENGNGSGACVRVAASTFELDPLRPRGA